MAATVASKKNDNEWSEDRPQSEEPTIDPSDSPSKDHLLKSSAMTATNLGLEAMGMVVTAGFMINETAIYVRD
jgi:hypothetical protein